MRIYLAGPDVFLADAREVGRRKVELCAQRGFTGLFPLDTELPSGDAFARRVFRANCELMESADVGLVNLTPFRGPSADAGTAFELGFLFARRKLVIGYSSDPDVYLARVARSHGPLARWNDVAWDRDELMVEGFGLLDNLMLTEAIAELGGEIVAVAESGEEALAALGAFRVSLDVLARRESAGPN